MIRDYVPIILPLQELLEFEMSEIGSNGIRRHTTYLAELF